jgi:two-component system LytT family response regulator
MAYRVLIVDDEAPARAKVKRLLAGDARFELAGEAADGAEAVAQVEGLRPDLLILDIQMPGLTGFEVIEALGADRCPKVVFSTAFDRYAIAAFDAAAIDYLLKPYDAGRFRQALDRAHARLAGGRDDAELLRGLAAGRPLERLLVKSGDAWVPLRLDRVTRLRAEDKYVRVYGEAGEHLVRQSLKVLESRVDPIRFVRVQRSEIVALDAVVRMEPWTHGDALLVLADGNSVVLSRSYREQFLERWGARG